MRLAQDAQRHTVAVAGLATRKELAILTATSLVCEHHTVGWRMWFTKTFYRALLLALTLGLFCSELPESFLLTDDVSNDFVEVSPTTSFYRVETVRRHLASESSGLPTSGSIRRAGVFPSGEPLFSLPTDLLRLFSIQRK